MLITVSGRMVRSHGAGEVALPESGRITLSPLAHGVHEGALRGRDSVVMRVVDGQASPVDLTPGPWRVRVEPEHGPAWDSWQVELEPGMVEPVDLAALAPVVVIDGEKWSQGLPGEPGASVTGGYDLGGGRVVFTLSDGKETAEVQLPPGPAGRGIVSVSDPDAESRVTITYTDGTTSTVQAIRGAQGEPGVQGDPGEPGADSTVPGPPGPSGPPGQVLTPESMLVVGPGRPDAPTTTGMSSAALAALPVGCEYRSTDGASVGAWVWAKRPSGWIVTEGEVSITPATLVSVNSPRITRIGPWVSVTGEMQSAPGSETDIIVLPSGFRYDHAYYTGLCGDGGKVILTPRNGGSVAVKGGGTWARLSIMFRSTNPWPTTLPS